jgi:uncharacterized membrane protein (DUF2068 family)
VNKLPKLDWEAVRQVINTGTMKLLEYVGFWKMNWWGQIFAVVFMIIAVALVMLGPFLLSALRLAKDGERPGIIGLVIMTISAISGCGVLLILVRIAQQVLEKHPGPIL